MQTRSNVNVFLPVAEMKPQVLVISESFIAKKSRARIAPARFFPQPLTLSSNITQNSRGRYGVNTSLQYTDTGAVVFLA